MNAKLLLTACPVLLLTLACSDGSSPTEPSQPRLPPPPPPQSINGSVGGWVVEEGTGQCVRDARIQIVDGPGTGTTVVQELDVSQCYDILGFSFDHLPPGPTVRLRAWAPRFLPQELEATVALRAVPVRIYLTPDPSGALPQGGSR